MSESTRRYDLLAAGVATFVSVLALAVSAYSTYWQRQATRATTWPRLTQHQGGSLEGTGGYGIELANTGTGPLELRTLVLRIDGTPVHSFPDLFDRVRKLHPVPSEDVEVSTHVTSSLGVGEKAELLHIDDKDIAIALSSDLMKGRRRLVVTACYCSVLDECWTTEGGNAPAVAVAACPDDPDNALRTLTPER